MIEESKPTKPAPPSTANYEDQFALEPEYYLQNTDFLNWFRYHFLIKDVLSSKSRRILEVGTGDGLVKNCLKPVVESYTVFDINEKLKPDILGDLREPQKGLAGKFDCAIVADVLEHIPFADLEACLRNLHSYLAPGGRLMITIPHRRSNFLFMSPTNKPFVFTVPTGFLSFGSFYRRFIKRKIWIDPHHCWEIGDGTIQRKDVNAVIEKAGFQQLQFKKLLYVDYWILGR